MAELKRNSFSLTLGWLMASMMLLKRRPEMAAKSTKKPRESLRTRCWRRRLERSRREMVKQQPGCEE